MSYTTAHLGKADAVADVHAAAAAAPHGRGAVGCPHRRNEPLAGLQTHELPPRKRLRVQPTRSGAARSERTCPAWRAPLDDCEDCDGNLELLPRDARVDPAAHDSAALRTAARTGNIDAVRRLLADGRVDAGARSSEALRAACRAGHPDMVARLLQYRRRRDGGGRADPAALDSEALVSACSHGHWQVAEMLLRDGRVDPTARDSAALRAADAGGHRRVVELLLRDGRADPSVLCARTRRPPPCRPGREKNTAV